LVLLTNKSITVSILHMILFSDFVVILLIYLTHLHQHSFPTRRSSDLEEKNFDRGSRFTENETPPEPGCDEAVVQALIRNRARVRSEEHTSELQSRSDLVCRLLLEKKKKINICKLIIIIWILTKK